ncbi:MAG: hypothetical protein AAGL98_03590, partial [Planctomycetota bacterium]
VVTHSADDAAVQHDSAVTTAPPTAVTAPDVTAPDVTAPDVTEQKRGRGRPRKEQSAGTAPRDAGEAALPEGASAKPSEEQAPAAPAQEAAPITIDDLRAALQVFTAKNGIEAGMPLLAKYNARRISEMAEQSEEAKAAFIKECQA